MVQIKVLEKDDLIPLYGLDQQLELSFPEGGNIRLQITKVCRCVKILSGGRETRLVPGHSLNFHWRLFRKLIMKIPDLAEQT